MKVGRGREEEEEEEKSSDKSNEEVGGKARSNLSCFQFAEHLAPLCATGGDRRRN